MSKMIDINSLQASIQHWILVQPLESEDKSRNGLGPHPNHREAVMHREAVAQNAKGLLGWVSIAGLLNTLLLRFVF